MLPVPPRFILSIQPILQRDWFGGTLLVRYLFSCLRSCVKLFCLLTCRFIDPLCDDRDYSPTVDGLQLDCCGIPVQRQCLDNAACKAKGLDGMCCPTLDGVFLDCCTAFPNEYQEPGSYDPAPAEATCELNSQCDALGLEGMCWCVQIQ